MVGVIGKCWVVKRFQTGVGGTQASVGPNGGEQEEGEDGDEGEGETE
jgi:hypothetical protein